MQCINKMEKLYNEVISHYKDCQYNLKYLSDTWAHTLNQKGFSYPLEEMVYMRSPGNRVNSWIVDTSYMIDQNCLDIDNPLIKHLLEIGENDFDYPRKDIVLNGKPYSSLFLRDVNSAAKLISLITESGLTQPKVLEIGGGIGLLSSILKSYFGDRITLFLADLPETLLIQEWYLRNCFSNSSVSFKASEKKSDFSMGGFNFINAYTLTSQDIEFDIVINMVSMDEMNQETINTYFKYIESNILPNGIFFFQNHYGQGTNTFDEPSEYEFNNGWI